MLLATGILGATVMPHVIYLHSALTQDRIPAQEAEEVQSLLRSQRVDVVLAMGLAGLVNLAMLVLAARLFFGTLRRAITMAPALVVLAAGVDPTQALVLSQAVLSFGIPFALVPLVLLTRRPEVMGALVNRSGTTVAATLIAAVVIALNVFLLYGVLIG